MDLAQKRKIIASIKSTRMSEIASEFPAPVIDASIASEFLDYSTKLAS